MAGRSLKPSQDRWFTRAAARARDSTRPARMARLLCPPSRRSETGRACNTPRAPAVFGCKWARGACSARCRGCRDRSGVKLASTARARWLRCEMGGDKAAFRQIQQQLAVHDSSRRCGKEGCIQENAMRLVAACEHGRNAKSGRTRRSARLAEMTSPASAGDAGHPGAYLVCSSSAALDSSAASKARCKATRSSPGLSWSSRACSTLSCSCV